MTLRTGRENVCADMVIPNHIVTFGFLPPKHVLRKICPQVDPAVRDIFAEGVTGLDYL